jgi:flagellar biosynthesis protein FlhB
VLALIVIVWIYLSYRSSPKQLVVATWFGLMLLVLIDYSVKRYFWYRGLMMDYQQMKEEHRDTEGDPHAKAYRQAMQRAISMQNLEERVRRAKVIVVGKNAKSSSTYERGKSDRSTA